MPKKRLDIISSIMLFLCALVLLIIVIGTVIAFVQKSSAKKNEPSRAELFEIDEELFGDLGRLRAKTNDSPPISIIFLPVVEYPLENKPAQEELMQKKAILRDVCIQYFSAHSEAQLRAMSEQELKQGLMRVMNAELSMFQISTIYLKEFIFLS